jgi:hypothetical protein
MNMVAIYRWGTRDLVLICDEADAQQLVPGDWYGRYVFVPLAAPETRIWRVMRGCLNSTVRE